MLPVAAVIISYQRSYTVLSCLGRLLALSDAPERIWLVDNAPDDGTASLVHEQFPTVEVLNAGGNLGFAAGNNLGMQKALDDGYEFILLLNDDAELLPGSLARLHQAMLADENIGAIGPVVYYGDGVSIWSAGGSINRCTGLVGHVPCPPSKGGIYEADYVTACAVLYRGEALHRAGLFDERFFMYYEDSDLGVRLADAGYHNVIDSKASALHHVPSDLSLRMKSPSFLYYLNRNRILFMRKHNPAYLETGALTFRSILELAIVLGKGNGGGFWAGLKGVAAGLRGMGGRMKGAN
jgi:GT2 family glycosyltransferase